MQDYDTGSGRELPLIKLIPNLLTMIAVCAGMSAIRFGFQGEYEWAVRLILLAALLDGLDGRLARLLRARSMLGAELDSLADFLNFGVAPGLILYAWSLNEIGGLGWIAALCFALCCLLRLARFNVETKTSEGKAPSEHFIGVPSPAGGVLVLMPLVLSLLLSAPPLIPATAVAAYTVFVGFLMISRIPTQSFKNITISRGNVRYVLLGVVLLAAALLMYTWVTLILLAVVYVLALIPAVRSYFKNRKKSKEEVE